MDRKSNSSVRYITQYVLSELKHKLPDIYAYHDFRHTLDVIGVCREYGELYNLDNRSRDLLSVAAVCHDYGYMISPDYHEMIGADMASLLMAAYQFRDKDIRRVRSLIMATEAGSEPKDLLEAIMADADLDYLSRADYPEISDRLFREWKALKIITTRSAWLKAQISFLESHRYHTAYALDHKEASKNRRLCELKQMAGSETKTMQRPFMKTA